MSSFIILSLELEFRLLWDSLTGRVPRCVSTCPCIYLQRKYFEETHPISLLSFRLFSKKPSHSLLIVCTRVNATVGNLPT